MWTACMLRSFQKSHYYILSCIYLVPESHDAHFQPVDIIFPNHPPIHFLQYPPHHDLLSMSDIFKLVGQYPAINTPFLWHSYTIGIRISWCLIFAVHPVFQYWYVFTLHKLALNESMVFLLVLEISWNPSFCELP